MLNESSEALFKLHLLLLSKKYKTFFNHQVEPETFSLGIHECVIELNSLVLKCFNYFQLTPVVGDRAQVRAKNWT